MRDPLGKWLWFLFGIGGGPLVFPKTTGVWAHDQATLRQGLPGTEQQSMDRVARSAGTGLPATLESAAQSAVGAAAWEGVTPCPGAWTALHPALCSLLCLSEVGTSEGRLSVFTHGAAWAVLMGSLSSDSAGSNST